MGTENTVLIEDILKASQEKSTQKRSPKVYSEICDNIDAVKINWKLIYLDTTCLSSSQIDQIHHNINTFSPRRHKIDMLRKLIQQGIQNIDVDRLFLSFSCVKDQ